MNAKKKSGIHVLSVLGLAIPVAALLLWYALEGFGSDASRVAPYRLLRVPEPDTAAEIAFYEERIRRNPDGGLDLASLAGVYLLRGEEEKADDAARRSLLNLPVYNEGAKLILAELAEKRHDFPEALRLAKEVLKENPGSHGALSILVTVNLGIGRVDEAERAANELVDRIPTLGSLTLRGLVMEAKGRIDEARHDFRLAIATEEIGEMKASAWARSLLARLHLRHGEYAEARALCRDALGIQPHDHFPMGLMARAEWKLGDRSRAKKLFERAHQISGEPIYLLELGRLTGDDDFTLRAEQIVRAEVEETPFGHRTELAEILLERGKAGEALPLVEADAGLRGDPGTLHVLALAQLANGRAKDARSTIREAMKWGYRDAELYRLAAQIETRLGALSRARLYEDLAKTVEGK